MHTYAVCTGCSIWINIVKYGCCKGAMNFKKQKKKTSARYIEIQFHIDPALRRGGFSYKSSQGEGSDCQHIRIIDFSARSKMNSEIFQQFWARELILFRRDIKIIRSGRERNLTGNVLGERERERENFISTELLRNGDTYMYTHCENCASSARDSAVKLEHHICMWYTSREDFCVRIRIQFLHFDLKLIYPLYGCLGAGEDY